MGLRVQDLGPGEVITSIIITIIIITITIIIYYYYWVLGFGPRVLRHRLLGLAPGPLGFWVESLGCCIKSGRELLTKP